MLTPERGGAPATRRKIAFSRIGYALSFAIFVIAVFVLYHLLRDIDPHELLAALKATDGGRWPSPAALSPAGYVTLTFYDLFALRTIGRADVPYRVAALGSFTSYAVGHNIGASVFSGGAVRYHIYSNWGLSVIDVTKLCFVAGLTFWFGNVTVLGLGILYDAGAARPSISCRSGLNRVFALLLLALLAAYMAGSGSSRA